MMGEIEKAPCRGPLGLAEVGNLRIVEVCSPCKTHLYKRKDGL
jgi:hypothetical protein